MRSLTSTKCNSYTAADGTAGTGAHGEVQAGIGAAFVGAAATAGVVRSDGVAGADLEPIPQSQEEAPTALTPTGQGIVPVTGPEETPIGRAVAAPEAISPAAAAPAVARAAAVLEVVALVVVLVAVLAVVRAAAALAVALATVPEAVGAANK